MQQHINFYIACYDRYLSIAIDADKEEPAQQIMIEAYKKWILLDDTNTCCEEHILEQLQNNSISFIEK